MQWGPLSSEGYIRSIPVFEKLFLLVGVLPDLSLESSLAKCRHDLLVILVLLVSLEQRSSKNAKASEEASCFTSHIRHIAGLCVAVCTEYLLIRCSVCSKYCLLRLS